MERDVAAQVHSLGACSAHADGAPGRRAARRTRAATVAVALGLLAPGAHAQSGRAPVAPSGERATAELARPELARPALADYDAPETEPDVLTHLRAAANVAFLNWAIWQLSWFRGADWVPVTRASLGANLRDGFEFDQDELQTNFFGHPYHGGLTFSAARSAGLGFWESVPYTFLGSLGWELFAEIERPSINDLLVTTLGGIMLGEISHRLSSDLLDEADGGGIRLLRELGAAAVSPMRGFNRLYTGRAWRSGPSSGRHPIEAELELGLERLRTPRTAPAVAYRPTLLVAADLSHGTLLRLTDTRTFEPLELFELYGAVNLFNSELEGAQIYATGLLGGRSLRRPEQPGRAVDEDVLGLAMTYDFQGSNLATYGGVGLGPAYYLLRRTGPGRTLRVGVGVDAVPIVGVTTQEAPLDGQRAYDFGAGGALWATLRWDLGAWGQLRVRSRQHAVAVLDGASGVDYVGATRLAYEIDAIPGLGGGAAPMLVYRRRLRGDTDSTLLQFQMQLFVKVHL